MSTEAATSFDEFIKAQARATEKVPIDKDKELAQWRGQVDGLYERIRGFLDRYINEGSVRIERKKTTLREELLGTYDLDALTLFLGANRIQFLPVGTFLIGARGRIDMTGPHGSVKFVLVDKDSAGPKIIVRTWIEGETPPPIEAPKPVCEWVWRIATPPPRITFIELEEQSFQAALMDVVNG